MKTLLTLLISFAVAPLLGIAQTEAIWNSIALSTVQRGKTITVRASCANTNLTMVEIDIDSKTFSVPKKNLPVGRDPHLETIKFSHFGDNLRDFYVTIQTGRAVSAPVGEPTHKTHFIFENEIFIRSEKWPIPKQKKASYQTRPNTNLEPISGSQ